MKRHIRLSSALTQQYLDLTPRDLTAHFIVFYYCKYKGPKSLTRQEKNLVKYKAEIEQYGCATLYSLLSPLLSLTMSSLIHPDLCPASSFSSCLNVHVSSGTRVGSTSISET